MGDPALALSFSEKLKMFGGKAYNSILPEKTRDNRDLVTRKKIERQRSGSIKSKLVSRLSGGNPGPSAEASEDTHSYPSEVTSPEEKSASSKKSFFTNTSDASEVSDSSEDTDGKDREKGKEKESLRSTNEGDASTDEEKLKEKEKPTKPLRRLSIVKPPPTPLPTMTETVAPVQDDDELGWHLLSKEEKELSKQFIQLMLQQRLERDEWKIEKETFLVKEKHYTKKLHKEKNRRRSAKKKLEQANKEIQKQERDKASLEKLLKSKDKEIETLKKNSEEYMDELKEQRLKFKGVRDAEKKGKDEISRLNQLMRRIEESLECVICNEDMATVVLLPCKHQVLCRSCGGKVPTCPICRIKVDERIHAFNHREKDLFRTAFTQNTDTTWMAHSKGF